MNMKRIRTAANSRDALTTGAAIADLLTKGAEMAISAAQIITLRGTMMATAGPTPTPAEQREFLRMGFEKVEAATASAQALLGDLFEFHRQLPALASAHWNLFTAAATFGSVRTLADLWAANARYVEAVQQAGGVILRSWGISVRAAHKGLRPVHARVSANARRLGASAGRSRTG